MTAEELYQHIIDTKDYDKLKELCKLADLAANHFDDGIRLCDTMTSGNFMHQKAYVRSLIESQRYIARSILELENDY